jgi:hypothetical protein
MADSPEDLLRPLIAALRRTPLGVPKAQTAVNANLAKLKQLLDSGFTYGDIAAALATAGVRGRSGLEISPKALRTMVTRALATSCKTAVASSPSMHGFWPQSHDALTTPSEAGNVIIPSRDGSSNDAIIGRVKQKLAEAKASKSVAATLK